MPTNTPYEKTFLKEVVFKINFQSVSKTIQNKLPKVLQDAIIKKFQTLELQEIPIHEFQTFENQYSIKKLKEKQWVFYDKDRKKSITINPNGILYKNYSYETYQKLIKDLENIFKIFFENIKDITISRMGLRYINIINFDEKNPLNWDMYINKNILGVINTNKNKANLTRVFHALGYDFDDFKIMYQFGISNPDFPSIIKRKQFIMDLDAYQYGELDYPDINTFIKNSHSKISQIFEDSITNETRNIMKKKV